MNQKYGIAEIYGRDFSKLKAEEIRFFAERAHGQESCPFKGGPCSKQGGVCSLRCYSWESEKETALPVKDTIVTTCPNRFYDNNVIFHWVGKKMIDCSLPRVLKELPFLKTSNDAEGERAIGKIDMVLVDEKRSDSLAWCAMEIQSVYFSGSSLTDELKQLREYEGKGTPFPIGRRRPDYRSSGPKRLMPQLQIKVPTITRWGRKTAVIVDRQFWRALGTISTVKELSNCDIAWFVVDYSSDKDRIKLCQGDVYFTTLDRAVEGLTGGTPTSLKEFEKEIKARLV